MKAFYFAASCVLFTMQMAKANDTLVTDSISAMQPDSLIIPAVTPTLTPDSTVMPFVKTEPKLDTVKEAPLKVEESIVEKPDTIVKKSGFAIICKVLEKNLYDITYIKKGEKLKRKISTRELKLVHYGNGKTDIIDNTPEKVKKEWVSPAAEVEWKRIKIANDAAAVAGMILKDTVFAEYDAQKITMGNDVLERNAIAIMQKKALLLKANTILVISKDIRREYGEIPSIRMSGLVYIKE